MWKLKWQEEQKIRRAEREAIEAYATKSMGAFASIEYSPPNNEVYRASLKTASRTPPLLPMLVYILVGLTVGLLGTAMRLG
eukprot:SAG31_NODE_11052_length_1071_cov_0.739712_1_plen_80_part_10